MIGIKYNPADRDMILHFGEAMTHISECEDCKANLHKHPQARAALTNAFHRLNDLSAVPIPMDDLDAAIAFCKGWMMVDGLQSVLGGLLDEGFEVNVVSMADLMAEDDNGTTLRADLINPDETRH